MAPEHGTERQVEAWLATFASPNTRAAYGADIAVFLAWCTAQGISPLHATSDTAERFQHDLLANGALAATVKRRASAVNGFLRSHWLTAGPAGDAPSPPSAGDGASTTVALSGPDRERVLQVLPDQASKAQVLVTMLMLDGLKLDEVLALDVQDVGGRPPQLEVNVTRGQVGHHFTLHPRTSALVSDHLSGRSMGPLLAGRNAEGSRLTRFGADYLVKRTGRDAGLDAPLTTNVLRRTYVSNAHASGDALADIGRRVGHSDVRTTRRYLPDSKASMTTARAIDSN